MDYPSVICEYCVCTDYGDAPVNTGLHNLCEGACCEVALYNYNDSRDNDEDKIASIEDAF